MKEWTAPLGVLSLEEKWAMMMTGGGASTRTMLASFTATEASPESAVGSSLMANLSRHCHLG
jgi:hypothetical protein